MRGMETRNHVDNLDIREEDRSEVQGHVETKSEKTDRRTEKWNQSDEESRKTWNMHIKSAEYAAEGRKGAETRIFVARLVEFVKRSQRPVAAGNIGPF